MAKEYTYNGEEYYPGATYQFKDKDGNIVESKGDNSYVWQAMTQGIPIYKNDKGEWYTEPYLETTQNGFVAHVPSWFRDTQEYDTWKNVYVPQIATTPINSDTVKSFQDIFKSLGSQGATRNALRTDVSRFGVTNRKLQDEYVDNIVKIVSEGKTKEKAKMNGIFGSDADESVADVARSYKNMSKEDLSKAITKLSIMSTAASRDGWTGSEEEQKQVADSIALLKLLNWVDDNPTQYGDGKEFEGLLQASFLQKFKRGFATASATFTESNVLGIPVRAAYGVSSAVQGQGFDMQIEKGVNNRLSTDPELGANLEGTEGAEAIGMWGGALTNIAASVVTMKGAGNLLNAKMADSSAAVFLNNMNNSGVVGKIAYDFFLNDLPLDTVMFINDIVRTNGNVGTALWDPANPQPLTGVPFIRRDANTGFWMPSGLGPDVPGGLVMNVIGDLIVDCAPWMIKTANNSVTKYMDGISNGGFTRFRENVSLKNLAGQEAFTKIPVIGKAWTKFVDHVIGPEKAEAIREGRRAAIAQHSLDPYIIAQNLATLKNHNGMTTVAPLLKMDDERLGISRMKNDFIKNGEKYGGFGETRVDWKTVDGNKVDSNYKAVPDALPRQVKQGLLDVERLSELKGEEMKDTGIIPDAARAKEIADIEKRLETTPKEILEFAQKFSDLNKALEQIAVKLGIKTQEWVDAYAADPRFASYMTRQSLVPGYSQEMIKRDPANAAILNKSRKGYYADNYIDPTLAFSMKAEALGRAYAWNEQAKAIASFQVAQNKLIAGKGGMETAQKLEEVRDQIKNNKEFRDAVKYDTILSTMNNEAQVIGSAFREINDLMHLPESISLRSIYNAMQNPRIKTFLDDFNQGKIKFADGAVDAAGLTDSDAAFIVKNTYAYQGNKITKTKGKTEKAAKNNPDVIAKDTTPDIKYTAGVSPEGVPYRYEVIDGEIQNFERLEDTQSITDSINTLGGSLYRIDFNDVEKFGNANAFALNRTILFYRDNMPNIPLPVDFKIRRNEKRGVLGWIEKPGIWGIDTYGLKIENGEIVATKFPTHMAEDWYAKGKEAKLREANEDMIRERAAPKNAVGAEYTPIHETGHMLMARLALLEANRKIKEGEIELPKSPEDAGIVFEKEFDRIHKEMAERALAKLGYKFSESEWQRQANTITTYAGSDAYHYETFSEAISDYAFNGADAQKFSIAIVEEMKQLSERYTTAATPLEVLKGNNLEVPKGLFAKEGSYNFTSKQKTDKQKAKWLDEWRQKNPYLETEPFMVDGKDYAKNVTADNTKNIEGYKQFATDHMERVPDTVLDKDVEDFALHVIRPGGDVDMYNSYLRDGEYKDIKDWAQHYIDDVEDMYADDIEDLAFRFFPEDAEKVAKDNEVDFNEKGYWDTMIKYQGALKDMLADKLLQATNGNYELNDSSIFYRGVSTEGNHVNKGGDFSWLKEGGKFKDDGFGFISLSDVAAKNYASHGSGDKYILEYHVPAGQRMFYFGEIGRGGNDGGAFVLPAGVTGKVGKITDLGDGIKKVEITLDGKWASNKTKIMTEDQYIKANLWDTFFQKEIRAFDSKAKSATPDKLIEKNNAFLDDLRDNAAKKMVAKIREASNSKFDEELATMALSRNGQDVADAMNDFIVKRVNQAAHELAENMEGGATETNLMTARATIWGDITVAESFSRMVAELTPDLSVKDVQESVGNIFKEQAEGFASVDRLPIDLKELGAEERRLRDKLYDENKHSIAVGKAKEKALREQGFIDDATQTIHYKQGGEDVYVVVSDPVVANILKKPSDFKSTGVAVEALAQLSNFIARTYRLGTTGLSPLALVRNLLRDPIQATITAGFNPLTMNLSPEAFYKSLRQYGLDDKTIADVQNRIRVWAGSSGLTAEMNNMGVVNVNSLTYRNRVEKLIKSLDNPKNKAGKVVLKIVETGEAPLEAWETMFRNQIGQQAFIKNFRRTQDVNKALSAAYFDASNATTNFSHSVGLFKRATGTVPYLSSAINGTRSFWVLFNKDPIGMITRITAGVIVPVMAITAWNLSDEDRRKKYMSLPEWFRQSHLVILDMDGGAFAFPLPEEVQQYFGTARKYIEFTQEASPYSLPQILTQGVFGMLPGDFDGFFGPDGQIDWGKGLMQLGSGLMPQAFTTLYEFIAEHDMFTGQDLSNYNGLNKTINTLSNIFGTGIKQVANDIGTLCGASKKDLIGLSTAETLARDLFGIGLDDAKNQFMEIVGSPKKYDAEKDKVTNPTGLFKENEDLKAQVKALDTQIATSDPDKKDELVKLRDEKIQAFTDKVSNLINKYMQLYSISGGLEEWKKERVVQLLTLGDAWTTAPDGSYQSADTSQAYLNERAQAQQRYLDAGLPGGPSLDALADNGSIDLQAAINRFYGVTKQATQDYKNAIKELDVKKTRDEFYDVIQRIYDDADAKGVNPDYDLIERIQARYLQQIDAVLVPIITKYGIGVLNNNDFIDSVRRQVNGMIPSDDWRQSAKNAKRFLSTKEFPTAGVDVKKWLKQRYTSAMKDRGLESDPEVVRQLQSIRKDINDGNRGAAQSKITSLMNGVAQANYYISAKDFQTLTDYSKMVK